MLTRPNPLLITAAAVVLFSVAATAQGRPPQPAPQPSAPSTPAPVAAEPQQTIATFGDWSLRCVRHGEGAQARRSCEVLQTIQAQGQAQPLAQIAIGRPEPGRSLRLVIVLPPNASFPSTVKLLAAENEPPVLELPWRRCLPGACLADLDIPAPVLNQLRARTEGGRIIFQEGAGRDVTVPFSLRGLAQAIDALARES